MPKVDRRGRRGKAGSAPRLSRPKGPGRENQTPTKLDTNRGGGLLDRLLDTPNLARVIPRLRPEMLHRVIERCGLEDCAALVALTTPEQLAGIFDLDLWRPGEPGLDEQFDAGRFGVWLEVLLESGASAAADSLAAMDIDLVITGLAQHIRVFDPAVTSCSAPENGDDPASGGGCDDGFDAEVGGYQIAATRADSWDAIVSVLVSLDSEHPECFHRVMAGCRRLSNSTPEVDGLDDLLTSREQVVYDLAVDRERRREKQGYLMPAQARAFLQMARHLRLAQDASPTGNPIASAYFRSADCSAASDVSSERGSLPAASAAAAPEDPAEAVAAVVEVLRDAGVLAEQPRALLDGPRHRPSRLGRIQAHMQFARDCDDVSYSVRSRELAYLANSIVAGCSIQARPFTMQEASDAVVAVCNLGLENWPLHWLPAAARRGDSAGEAGTALPEDFLVGHDLVVVFQVGWKILYQDVVIYAAERLITVLKRLRCKDLHIQRGLDELRIEMTRQCQAGTPWRARDALDVISSLDMPAWATLLGLIDECPVIHAGLATALPGSRTRAVSGSAFEFISENGQISAIRQFMQLLPDTLRG
jgi:Family of unknown function (DUF6178)